jgi:hypothetical protein
VGVIGIVLALRRPWPLLAVILIVALVGVMTLVELGLLVRIERGLASRSNR